ncbi:MAG: hypothetical protein LBQ52_06290 [Helicobacteraceae bacterium]|jgi:hypothetical protein|nr:hypothetical protein [Helicobacteraceae bacterium]
MTDNKSKSVSNFQIAIAFCAIRKYFYGDFNDREQIKNADRLSMDLYLPINRTLVCSTNIDDLCEELIKYYENILTLAKKYKREIEEYYFWASPIIIDVDTNETLICFPFRDVLEEILEFFAILKRKNKIICFESDEDYNLNIELHNGRIFITKSDYIDLEKTIYHAINIDRDETIKQIDIIAPKLEALIAKLIKRFRFDYWTKYK